MVELKRKKKKNPTLSKHTKPTLCAYFDHPPPLSALADQRPSNVRGESLPPDPSHSHEKRRPHVRIMLSASLICSPSCKCNHFSGEQLVMKHFPFSHFLFFFSPSPHLAACLPLTLGERTSLHTSFGEEMMNRAEDNGEMSVRDVTSSVPLAIPAGPPCSSINDTSVYQSHLMPVEGPRH